MISTKRTSSEASLHDDRKKPRLDGGEKEPSKVVHVRGLPTDCKNDELVAIASPFGRVDHVLLLKGKGQAFIQLQNEKEASNLIHYYTNTVGASIRGRQIHFNYSSHKELEGGTVTTVPQPIISSSSSGISLSSSHDGTPPNNILLATVTNVVYPITIEILHQIFCKFGVIIKIVVFTKGPSFQALIQFSDIPSAITAKQTLDGQHIYAGCCHLKVVYSSMKNLNVKYNNDRSRDFTNPTLPTTVLEVPQHSGGHPIYGHDYVSYPPVLTQTHTVSSSSSSSPTTQRSGGVVIVSGLDSDHVTPDVLFTLFGVYGDVVKVKILFNKKDTALVQFNSPQQAALAIQHLNGAPLHGKTLAVSLSKHGSISVSKADEAEPNPLSKDFTGSPMHRFRVPTSRNYTNIAGPNSVLHLSNIPANAAEEDLRALFSPYGHVKKFKFFNEEHKMAFVEMSTVQEAVDALIALHGHRMGQDNRSYLRVAFSKSPMS